MKPVVVGISGASGAILAQSTVQELLRREVPTALVCSNAGRLVWQEELDVSFNETLSEWQEHPQFTFYPINDLRAPIASGTFPTRGMVLVPSSMNSIASIANGLANNLLLRAADVRLKEKRQLVLVPRANSAVAESKWSSLVIWKATGIPNRRGMECTPYFPSNS